MSRGTSDSGDGECGDIDALEKRYQLLAKGGQNKYPLAAENMEYWLSSKGGTKTIPSKYFVDDDNVLKFLKKVRSIFLSEKDKKLGIVPRIKKDNKAGKEYAMTWEDSMYASLNSDLFYALGGFTIVSDVKMKVVEIKKDEAKVSFKSWSCTVNDTYDWDVGKMVKIPVFGVIKDEEALCLEKAGRAKSFKMKSEAWDVKDKSIVGDATVDLS